MPRITNNQVRRVAVNVNLTVGMLEQLDALAEAQGLSRSALMRQAIEQLIEDMDDIAVSEARLKEERIPWEVVKAEAGL
jgi:predicted DNA-binding protein